MFVDVSWNKRPAFSSIHESGECLTQRFSIGALCLCELNDGAARARFNHTRIVSACIETEQQADIGLFQRVKTKRAEIVIMHDPAIVRMRFINGAERISRDGDASAKFLGKLSELIPIMLMKDALVEN